MKVTELCLIIFTVLKSTETANITLGQPETNILTRDVRDKFTFTGYPNIDPKGKPSNVADEQSHISTQNWEHYGYYTKEDKYGLAYLKVDLKGSYYVRSFGVSGYAGGDYKPTGNWYLEGSTDDTVWKMTGIASSYSWYAPGTYPFTYHQDNWPYNEQIVKCIFPAKYRYYRVIASGWVNGSMLIQNLGLFQ